MKEKPSYTAIFTDSIAELAGLDALYPENDLRELLVKDLEENIKSFKESDIDQMTHEQLDYWVKWASKVEVTVERANGIVESGNRLLSMNNLSTFLQILGKQEEVNKFRNFLRGLSGS